MRKYILILCFVLLLVGCSKKNESEEKLQKIKNAEAVHTSAIKMSGTVVLDNGKEILELNYHIGHVKFKDGKKYDVYYRGSKVKGAKQLK